MSGLGPASVTGAGAPVKPAGEAFSDTLSKVQGPHKLDAKPAAQQHQPVTEAKGVTQASGGVTAVGSAQMAGQSKVAPAAIVDQLQSAQNRMDEVLKLAESGKSFSPAELLSLQAQVYRASQELDLAGKVVEKATGGLKQVLQTQL
jgi:hypothetical protein